MKRKTPTKNKQNSPTFDPFGFNQEPSPFDSQPTGTNQLNNQQPFDPFGVSSQQPFDPFNTGATSSPISPTNNTITPIPSLSYDAKKKNIEQLFSPEPMSPISPTRVTTINPMLNTNVFGTSPLMTNPTINTMNTNPMLLNPNTMNPLINAPMVQPNNPFFTPMTNPQASNYNPFG